MILISIHSSKTSICVIQITLSNPAEYFLVDPRSFIKPDTYTRIKITPFVKKIDPQLKWRSPETRKCYLHNERKLSIFQQYTQGNCNHECVLNETLTICGCVSFDMVCKYLNEYYMFLLVYRKIYIILYSIRFSVRQCKNLWYGEKKVHDKSST